METKEEEKILERPFGVGKEPFFVEGDAIVINHENLNAALAPYNMKVDVPSDIVLDDKLTALNKGTVMVIHAVDLEPKFNASSYFSKELEDKFEGLADVYSCDIDKGELTITLVMNTPGLKLKEVMASGGAIEVDPEKQKEIELQVDGFITANKEATFEEAGIDLPEYKGHKPKSEKKFNEKMDRLLPQVRDAILKKRLDALKPDIPVIAFYAGRKFDMGKGHTPESAYLVDAITNRLFNAVLDRQQEGTKDEPYAEQYARSRVMTLFDNICQLAKMNQKPFFHITEGIIDDQVKIALGDK